MPCRVAAAPCADRASPAPPACARLRRSRRARSHSTASRCPRCARRSRTPPRCPRRSICPAPQPRATRRATHRWRARPAWSGATPHPRAGSAHQAAARRARTRCPAVRRSPENAGVLFELLFVRVQYGVFGLAEIPAAVRSMVPGGESLERDIVGHNVHSARPSALRPHAILDGADAVAQGVRERGERIRPREPRGLCGYLAALLVHLCRIGFRVDAEHLRLELLTELDGAFRVALGLQRRCLPSQL